MIEIRLVQSKKEWNDFFDLPWKVYKDNPVWVPPLRIAVKELLDVKKNPFFKHATMYPLMAYQNGEPVGRVAGVIDDQHNSYTGEKTAFFGFYECVPDQKVSDALLEKVVKWAKSKGMSLIRGPMNPSTNYECGLLVDGFEDSPTIMNPYNPPYYQKFVESFGFKKARDLFAYNIRDSVKFSDTIHRKAERLKARGSIIFRPVNMKKLDEEVDKMFEVYNDAWEKNWGFVPMGIEEFKHQAKDFKMIVDPELCLIAEVKGKIAGFALALPDINQAFKKIKNGKLLPFGIFKLLWNLKGPGKKKTINRCRIITMGIKKDYQNYGLGPLFYMEYQTKAPKNGYPVGEASWILEDNTSMNKAMEHMGAERSKVYRIYDRPI